MYPGAPYLGPNPLSGPSPVVAIPVNQVEGLVPPEAHLLDYDVSGNLIYEGFAPSGSLTSSPVWAIRKNTYNGAGQLVSQQTATGGGAVIWDNRAALAYS